MDSPKRQHFNPESRESSKLGKKIMKKKKTKNLIRTLLMAGENLSGALVLNRDDSAPLHAPPRTESNIWRCFWLSQFGDHYCGLVGKSQGCCILALVVTSTICMAAGLLMLAQWPGCWVLKRIVDALGRQLLRLWGLCTLPQSQWNSIESFWFWEWQNYFTTFEKLLWQQNWKGKIQA